MLVLEAIKLIYPNIQGGYSYFETENNGNLWQNPIDGLVWENTEYPKPIWKQIEEKLPIVELNKAKADKLAQLEINYQHFVDKPFKATSKLIENGIPTNKDVEYLFDCETKEDSKRDPSAICFATLLNSLVNKDALIDKAFETSTDFATFKQTIINGNKELANKVFTPYITKDLAGNKIVAMFSYQNAKQLALHIGNRLATALMTKGKITADINNAKSLEELELININF